MKHHHGIKRAAQAVPEHLRGDRYYSPAVDIVEKPDEILLIADVPGAKPEDIDVQFEDGTLTLHARVTPRYAEGVEFLRQEYGVGDFLRVFHVSEAIDAAKISAEYADGVLTLHLPKSAGLRPRKIEVAVKS
ncbi:Hsp20/alpha crystallin family protein [Thermogutta sp.]|jgi:HSP20 family molecular chaperone IbpA|uniref:Hsp20/alpha crystallin family protein n=1 Tax=Thermogutta sp. TaxID=1962930 RepID=UPI0032202F83